MTVDSRIVEVAQLEALWKVSDRRNGRARKHSSARPRIAVILPRGEAIRNFVYTGALDEVAREAEVALLSVMPCDDLRDMLTARFDHVFPLHQIPEKHVVDSVREILDMAHGRWLWSEAARERWRLREAEATTARRRVKRELKKLACYPFASRYGLQLLSNTERALSRWYRTDDEYTRLFTELKPALVFNASHVHSQVAIQAVQAAQRLAIPTATFIFSWDNLTSQGRIIPPYDYYLVWNDAIRNQLLDIYHSVRPDQVFVTGTPQFDFHFRREFNWSREEFCKRVGADPKRPIVFYATGMANHMPGEPQIVAQIAEMIREMPDLERPQLMVRVYPKDLTGRFEEIKKLHPDVLFPTIPWESEWLTPRLEDAYLLTNMLRHCALGINVASTVSLELCMFDKPVINVGYNPPDVPTSEVEYARYYQFDHYRPLVERNAVKLAKSQSEMRQMIRKALTTPKADSDARRAFIARMFGHTLDGYSGLRVAARLIKLAEVAAAVHA